jgi:hypothetical protein
MITITVTPSAMRTCCQNAEQSVLPRGSSGWEQRTMDRRREDQIVAQLGHWAFCYWKDGDELAYLAHREACNELWWEGDGGTDVLGLNVDVKASLMRSSPDAWRYNLLCRSPEPASVYVLALVPTEMDRVHLMGWATGESLLETEPVSYGPLEGARAIPALQLFPLPPFRWT